MKEKPVSTAVEEPVAFIAPPSQLGPCIWYHAGDRNNPHAAFITKTGTKAVGLCVVQAGSLKAIQGALHIDDPDLQTKPFWLANGAWDYWRDEKAEAPSTVVVAKLTEQVKSLEKRLASLEKQLS